MNSTIEKTSTKSQLRKQYKELFENSYLYKYGFADDIIDNILKFTDDAPLEYIKKNEDSREYSRLSWSDDTISEFYDKHTYAIHAYLFRQMSNSNKELFDMSEYRFDLWEYKVHIIKLFEEFIDGDLEYTVYMNNLPPIK